MATKLMKLSMALGIVAVFLVMYGQTTPDLFIGSLFQTTVDSQGAYYCPTNTPTKSFVVRSPAQCLIECISYSGCNDFSVFFQPGNTSRANVSTAQASECQLFDYTPTQYTMQMNCIGYQKPDSPCPASATVAGLSSSTVVSTQCCQFPFTYNGVSYSSCAVTGQNTDGSNQYGCLLANRTWVTCRNPTSFSYSVKFVSKVFEVPTIGFVAAPGINNWIVIQWRHGLATPLNMTARFNQTWASYKQGFGSSGMTNNFWIGNEALYQLTSLGPYNLHVEIYRNGVGWYSADYWSFSVGSESPTNYKLSVSGYTGDAVDALAASTVSAVNSNANGMPFSTYDNDNDQSGGNCAQENNGGWWYNQCTLSCLNSQESGMALWATSVGPAADVTKARMMIRQP